jgi:hypothetical protein
MSDIVIRPAVQAERSSLEALQWRASLPNSGDCDSLLANPDAIALPAEQTVAARILHVVGNAHEGPGTDHERSATNKGLTAASNRKPLAGEG